MKREASTIAGYFDSAEDFGPDLAAIDQLIVANAPELKRQLFSGPSITMVGYGEIDWENNSGSGAWPLIGMAAQKHYIALYVAAVRDGETLADFYSDRLGRTNNGKNCIRFKRLSDIDPEQLANAVRDAVAWAEVQREEFGRNCAAPVDGSDD